MAQANQQPTLDLKAEPPTETKAAAAAPAAKPAKAKKSTKQKGEKLPAKKEAGKKVAVAKTDAPPSRYAIALMLCQDRSVAISEKREYLAMLKEEERLEAERLFDTAMLAAQERMPKVSRDAYNSHTKSWWARLETVSEQCDPVIREHGFTLSYSMEEPRIPDYFHIVCDVTWRGVGEAGNKLSYTKRFHFDVGRDDMGAKGSGTKTAAQGSISVMTIGRRVLKLSIFDVIVLGMDRDGSPAGAELCSAEDISDARKRMKKANIDETMVCQVYKVDKLDHLMKADLPSLLQRIEMKERATS